MAGVMEEAYLKQSRRAAELGMFRSADLSDMLTAAGWQLTNPARQRKQDKVRALLHLEEYDVLPEIVESLGLARLEPVV